MTSLTDSPMKVQRDTLPLGGLLALASAGFITILTEAMPAGLLPQMGAGLGVSPALVGQLVTLYALGSLLAAIPLTLLTRGWRRRPLLLVAIAGFALVNSVTAISSHYGLTLVARFFAGVFAGLLWALLAGYASRMVAPHLQGRAIAIAMLGAPLALTLGAPAGTLLGTSLTANRPGQVGGRVGGRRAVDAGDGMEPGHCRWRSGGRVVVAELGRARVSLGGSGVDVAGPLQTPMKKPPVFSGRGLFIQTEISTS